MPVDFSFLQNAAPAKPEQPEQKPDTGMANVTVRVDADCFMQCDGEYVDIQLKAGQVTKTELPVGQHLLEFLSTENTNVKVEKNMEVKVVAVGVGTRSFPVKIIVADKRGNEFFQDVAISKTNSGMRDDDGTTRLCHLLCLRCLLKVIINV